MFEETLRSAADEAMAYRQSVGKCDRAGVLSYPEMLERLSGPLP